MERFVRLTAPVGKIDFVIKLIFLMLIAGCLNHFRDVVTDGFAGAKPFWENLLDTTFTSFPMCVAALLLFGHLNRLQERLYAQAMRDALTQLPNRRWFMENTPAIFGPGQTMIMIDIDRFKSINDTFGHDVGDRCLQQMATHLADCLGHGSKLARIGGEEFAACLEQNDGRAIADRISKGFAFDTGGGNLEQVTASVGLARRTIASVRSDMLKLADIAVYQAKSAGRARYAIVTETAELPHERASQRHSTAPPVTA